MGLLGFEGFDDNSGGFPDETLGAGQGASGSTTTGGIYWQAVAGSVTKQTGQLGGSAMALQSNGQYKCFLNGTYTRLIWGARIRTFTNFATNPATIVAFYTGTTAQCGLSFNTSGNLIFWRGTPSTVLATGATAFTTSSWYYIEIDVTFNSSTGAFNVRINGSGSEISGSGVNTVAGANQCDAFWFTDSNALNSVVNWYDDLYLLDPTTGSSPYTSMLGVCRVETLFPAAASATSWTPNASTNVSRVQETSMDSDTTYNSTPTTGQDTFTHGALSSTPATIFAAAVRAVVRKDQTSNPTAQTILVSGATTQAGAVNTQATTYLTMRDIYLNDPNTGSAWTATGINNAAIGYNRTL